VELDLGSSLSSDPTTSALGGNHYLLDLGSSTWLITNKPWDPGKQLPLGFSVFGQLTVAGP